MLNFSTYEDINKLKGVKSAFSEFNASPLHDANITIFFMNGYRLVSRKSILGQTIELQPFNNKLLSSDSPGYAAYIVQRGFAESNPDNKIIEQRNGNDNNIDLENFAQNVSNIIGKDVFDFLTQRHASIPFTAAQTNADKCKI
jgi:hypothetical protein